MSGIRIATSNIFAAGTARISEAQAQLLKTQQQIAANRRILTPSDDPVAAARALEVKQSQSMNETFAANRVQARNALEFQDTTLDSITGMLTSMKTQFVQAGNASLDASQRKYLAADLRTQYQELLGLVNSRDAQGRYLFSGFQVDQQPFTINPATGGVDYAGDQGQKSLMVGAAREMSTGDSGDAIFLRVPNKAFGVAAASGNTGNLAISGLSMPDRTLLTGHDYEVVITGVDSADGPQYSVYDMKLDPQRTGTPLATGAYVDGDPITVDGVSFTLSGSTPANGDIFTVRPNAYQDIFKTLDSLIAGLEDPGMDPVSNARRARTLKAAGDNFDSAMDGLLTVRASVGSRLKELDNLDSAGDDRKIQYQKELSQLEDLDYVKALSDLTMQSTTLEAAQKSFLKTSSLSLFALL